MLGLGLGLNKVRSVVVGVSLGSEEVVNGGFDTSTDWNFVNNFQYGVGVAETSAPTTGAGWVYQNKTLTTGTTYRISADITVNAGSGRLGYGSNLSAFIDSSNYYEFDLENTAASTFFGFRAETGFDGTIDNISIKEVL